MGETGSSGQQQSHVVVVGAGWAGWGAAKALCEAGVRVTLIDGMADPSGCEPVTTRSGKPFVSIPYSLELNDTIAYVVQKMEPRRYGEIIRRAFDQLYAEGAESGTVMCIPTHNYQVSCPHRLRAFEEALEYITGHSDVWVTTGREIAEYSLSYLQEQLCGGAESAT